MEEYILEVKRTLLQIMIWGAMIASGAYFSDLSWRIPGLLLGTSTSMIYFLLMCYRVKNSAEMSVPKAISYMRLGWLLRLSFIALMLILSIKIPLFDFISAVIGLFSLQVVIIGNAGIVIVKSFCGSAK
jgi:hypothetical protein